MVDALKIIDQEIIKRQLLWDSRVNATDIDVTIEDGHVTLNGTVPTYLDRLAAYDDVWRLSGVHSVDNRLVVRYPSDVDVPPDSEIKANLSRVMQWHPTLDASNIEIMCGNGHVEVDGTVDSYWQKILVDDIIANTAGVTDISNRLAVVPRENAADEETAKDIVEALHRSSKVDATNIDVRVEEGHVVLSGRVPDTDAYRTAYDTAAYTFGVINVHNKLVITGRENAYKGFR